MKKIFYLFVITFITIALFNSTAKATEYDHDYNHSAATGYNGMSNHDGSVSFDHRSSGPGMYDVNPSHNTPSGGGSPSTNLPINSGVWVLMIAGLAMGIVTIKKYKALKPAMVKQVK
jgi:hypothetical protein